MVMTPRPSSSGTRSTDRELHHRRPNKKPLFATTGPITKQKPSAARPPLPPSRSTPVGATPPRLKPGTAVQVRTRTEKTVAGKAVVLWLPAVVVSATDDGGYEVVYEGKLPRWDPFATVHVQRDHVRLQKRSPPPPPPSATTTLTAATTTLTTAGPCASATATTTLTAATCKNS